jgi:hypothetical protein
MRNLVAFLGIMASLTAGCRSAETIPEPGAVLLRVLCAPETTTPDELWVSVFDDTGVLWENARVPASGPLVPKSATELGTLLIQPGSFQGPLRVHARGLAAGVRVGEGTLSIPAIGPGQQNFDLLLTGEAPADGDGDGVPDVLDDCPTRPNPRQGGCGTSGSPDAGPGVDATVADTGSTGGGKDAKEDSLGPVDTKLESVDAPPSVVVDALVDGPRDLSPARDSAPEARLDTQPGEVADVPRPKDAAVDSGPVDANQGEVEEDPVCDGPCPYSKSQGAVCAESTECASGECVDGVCCSSACVGPCRSCNQPGMNGQCSGYPAGLDPEDECAGAMACNGVGACGTTVLVDLTNGQLCGNANQCRSGHCVDGVCCNSACATECYTCGTGVCSPVYKADDVPQCTGTRTCNKKGMCVASAGG